MRKSGSDTPKKSKNRLDELRQARGLTYMDLAARLRRYGLRAAPGTVRRHCVALDNPDFHRPAAAYMAAYSLIFDGAVEPNDFYLPASVVLAPAAQEAAA